MAAEEVRIAQDIEIAWLEGCQAAHCPNCGADALMTQQLRIDYRPPDAHHRYILHICPECAVRFVDNTHTMDYHSETLIEIGWHVYQVQIGAGLWPIAAPLTRVAKPKGARVLEIGGAYGFGLDFCIRARGWRGEGFDPSPLAVFGARELGLNIRQAYFDAENLATGPWDVAIATELVEHLEHPPEFFALMRRALADDGILVLTTPDARWITPDIARQALVAFLSPGSHLVLQTRTSLEAALKASGFTDVIVLENAYSLVAFASGAPFTLHDDPPAARAMFQNYLIDRNLLTDPLSDLRLGFAGRGLFEAAMAGDAQAAERAWASLLPAVHQRFRLELNSMSELPPGAPGASLAELAALMPLGLGMMLFSRVMVLQQAQVGRARLLPMLRLAGAAIAALQAALAQRSLSDGLSADIAEAIKTEILLCQAEAGDAACVPGLIARADVTLGWRGFVGLVNAGALAQARALRDALLSAQPGPELPSGLRRDALLSLVNLELAPEGEATCASHYAQALAALGEDVAWVYPAVFIRLVNGSRYAEALAMAADHDIDGLAQAAGAGTTGHDVRLARMVLDLAVGDPAQVPKRLKGLEISPTQAEALLLQAFIRLVNGSRYAEALEFIAAHDVAGFAARQGGEVARNVGLARMVLDLAVGDPAEIPGRLAGLEIDPPRRDALLLEAFIRLVNGSRYDEALEFIGKHDIDALAARQGGEVARNVGLARMVLDLAVGDPAQVPKRLAGLEIPPAQAEALLLQAFIRLVNGSRYAEALEFIAAHDVAGFAARQGGEVARNVGLARMVLDLAVGDPAQVPKRLAGIEIDPERRDNLLLGAFTGLVNMARYGEAHALRRDAACFTGLDQMPGKAATDARIAQVALELNDGDNEEAVRQALGLADAGVAEELWAALLLDGFVRLVNAQNFAAAGAMAEAHGLENHLRHCGPALRQDAAAALLLLEIQAGSLPERLVARVAQAEEAGLVEPRLRALTLASFVTLVNHGAHAAARSLLPRVEPWLTDLRLPFDDAACNALFAAGMLFLQEPDDRHRAAVILARLREGLVERMPDPLFWPALRGEVVALYGLDRAHDALDLLQACIAAYQGAPEDLRQQIERKDI